MISVIPGTTKWFWPGCHCAGGQGDLSPCAGHAAMPPGMKPEDIEPKWTLNPMPIPHTTIDLTPWTVNKLVACTPFKTLSNEKTMKAGLALQDKKVRLQELTVVLRNEDGRLQPGMRVYVRGDGAMQVWAKDVFTLDDKEFILVPETAIQVVQWQSGS